LVVKNTLGELLMIDNPGEQHTKSVDENAHLEVSQTPKAKEVLVHSKFGNLEIGAHIQTVAAIAQSLLAVAALLSSVAVALYVWYGQAEMTKRQIEKSTRDSWIAVDLAALANDGTLIAADNLMDPKNAQDPIEKRRKRWFGYAIMNIIIERYDAAQQGLIGPKEDAINSCKELLSVLVADDDIYEITQGHGYETRIKALSREIRAEVMKKRNNLPAPSGK
jgi:hypothetical protein